jgi:hypothetical protein
MGRLWGVFDQIYALFPNLHMIHTVQSNSIAKVVTQA